ncbi:MAG: hypothetical protein M1825_002057 [Sarcosagium campestre]|nr:MAG: hypothetical protein M1825_002057 [Sarcosagium campestre]
MAAQTHQMIPSSSPAEGFAVSRDEPPLLELNQLPPLYLLPTHFSLSELHEAEENLLVSNAKLTYDATEAKIFIGKVGTKPRAEFELRCRQIWTEDAGAIDSRPHKVTEEQSRATRPSLKRRRNEAWTGDKSNEITGDNSSTESDRDKSPKQSVEKNVINEPKAMSDDELLRGAVVFVKYEWFLQSQQAKRILPISRFVVYRGRIVPRPKDAKRSRSPTNVSSPLKLLKVSKSTHPGGQVQRSSETRKQDEQTRDARQAQPNLGKIRNRFSRTANQHPAQPAKHPPTLLRQNTSEYEQEQNIGLPEMPDWVKQGKKYACERATPARSPNEAFLEQLKKIKLARLLNGDTIGVRAYSTSIASLAAYPYTLSTTREILALPGCDSKIAALFNEWRANAGRIQAVQDIEDDETLSVLRTFYEIWGVGDHTARAFYHDRGWRDLDDIVEHGWSSLSRVQQIGVKFYDDFQEKIPRREVESIAAQILTHARSVRDPAIECAIVGGYRRGKTHSGDVDVILSHRDESKTLNLVHDVVVSLEQSGWITHTLQLSMQNSKRDQNPLPHRADGGGHGFDTLDKALVVWQDIGRGREGIGQDEVVEGHSRIHRRVDIIISPWRTVGCAVLGWSGGTTFQRDLRRYAKLVKGWKFDSSGVRDRATGHVVDLEGVGGLSRTWEEAERKVFAGFGLEFREPWERCTG